MAKELKFEDYLQERHGEQYTGTDDMMPDDFNIWLDDLSDDDWIAWGDKFAAKKMQFSLKDLTDLEYSISSEIESHHKEFTGGCTIDISGASSNIGDLLTQFLTDRGVELVK